MNGRRVAVAAGAAFLLFVLGVGAAVATHTQATETHVLPFTIGNVTGAVTITDFDPLPHETVTVTVTGTTPTTTTTEPPPPSNATCDRTASPGSGTAQSLFDSLTAGQTGCLRGGVYTSTSTYVLRATTGGKTIRSFPGERARLAGSIAITQTADRVTISDLDIVGKSGDRTIYVNAADTVIERNDITNEHRGNSCLILGSPNTFGRAVRTIIRDNRVHHCGQVGSNLDHGVYAGYSDNAQILGNVFYSSAAYSVQVYPDAQGTVVRGNVIDGGSPSVRGGIVLGSEGNRASSNTLVESNVIAYAVTYNIDWYWGGPVGSGNVVRHNCLWAGGDGNVRGGSSGITVTDSHVSDPLFRNRANRDYRLQPGSSCLAFLGFDPAS